MFFFANFVQYTAQYIYAASSYSYMLALLLFLCSNCPSFMLLFWENGRDTRLSQLVISRLAFLFRVRLGYMLYT